MKTMTCKQLGGPKTCDKEFHAETWEEMKQQSMNHGHEMYKKHDEAHMKAMGKMKELMKDPKAMKSWMDNKKRQFDVLPNKN